MKDIVEEMKKLDLVSGEIIGYDVDAHIVRLNLDRDDLIRIDSLLRKATQKKVTHESTIYTSLTCPNCKNVVDEFTEFQGKKVRVQYKFCHFCGQRLDWSDEDE